MTSLPGVSRPGPDAAPLAALLNQAGSQNFQVGADIVNGGPGLFVFAPRNAPHTLANHGTTEARILCLFAPGGFERRFERMLARESGQDIPDALAELAEAERLTKLIGPPLTPPA